MFLFFVTLLTVATIGLFFWLHGDDLSPFDKGYPKPIAGTVPSEGVAAVVQSVAGFTGATAGLKPGRARLTMLRQALDGISETKRFDVSFRKSGAGEPQGEWVLSADGDSDRRLLYVHGGGFVAGSPKSHRVITSALAELTGMAVFSLDYRLVPEHSRLAGLDDTENAFIWLTENGPQGPGVSRFMAVAGDSAGGNLILAAVQRLRDKGLKNADAIVGICPSTDLTMRSPSLHANLTSDLMLGGGLAPLLRMPAPLRHAMIALTSKRSPASPELSPLRGDLTDLPPILLQVSLTEMLLDDSARYFHRAKSLGADVSLQTYDNMVHVWHMFYPELSEAKLALEGVANFLRAVEEGGECGAFNAGEVRNSAGASAA